MTTELHEWETVVETGGETLERCRVPGGWLYRSMTITLEGYAVAMVFVPEGVHCSNCCPEDEQ